jgi:4-oxalocrotonate tautomerase
MPNTKRKYKPFVNIKLEEGVFSTEEKPRLAAVISDVMVKFEGSEAFREVVWGLIDELHRDGWHIGGEPFAGPSALKWALGRCKQAFEALGDDNPQTHPELAVISPVRQK